MNSLAIIAVFYDDADTKKAETWYRKAFDIFKSLNKTTKMGDYYSHLAYIHKSKGADYVEKMLLQSIALYDQAGHHIKAGDQYLELADQQGYASAKKALDTLALADKHYAKASAKVTAAKLSAYFGKVHVTRAELYDRLEKQPLAHKHYRLAIARFQAAGDIKNVAEQFHSIGTLYSIDEKYGDAEKAQMEALTRYEKISNNEGIVKTTGSLASIYLEQKKPVLAQAMLKRCRATKKNLKTDELVLPCDFSAIVEEAYKKYLKSQGAVARPHSAASLTSSENSKSSKSGVSVPHDSRPCPMAIGLVSCHSVV